MNDRQDVPLHERINGRMNLILFVASALAFPSVVFLHRNMGRRYVGPQALLSAVVLFFWPIVDAAQDPRPMFWFLGLFFVMCIISRGQGLRRKATGDPVYRHYDGTPRLMGCFHCRDELRFKRFQEPVLVFFFGMLAGAVSPLLAYFLMASAVGLAVSVNMVAFAHEERAEALRDQMMEQKFLAERFRRPGGK